MNGVKLKFYLVSQKKNQQYFKCLQQRELNAGTLMTQEVEELMPNREQRLATAGRNPLSALVHRN